MNKFQAIIFDMDGTIIDTEVIWKKATKLLIERKGIVYTPELEKEINAYVHGLALHKTCKLLKDILKLEDEVEHLIQEKAALANSMYEEGIRFIEGFTEFHKIAEVHQLAMAIATNATPCTVTIAKKALNLEQYFGQHIYDISHVDYVCKPDPAIYLHAAEQLGIDPALCIAIEDSAHGAQAAKSAGMFCIGINTSRNKTALSITDFIIEGYEELHLPTLLSKRNTLPLPHDDEKNKS